MKREVTIKTIFFTAAAGDAAETVEVLEKFLTIEEQSDLKPRPRPIGFE